MFALTLALTKSARVPLAARLCAGTAPGYDTLSQLSLLVEPFRMASVWACYYLLLSGYARGGKPHLIALERVREDAADGERSPTSQACPHDRGGNRAPEERPCVLARASRVQASLSFAKLRCSGLLLLCLP